jgi:hypothetical protein
VTLLRCIRAVAPCFFTLGCGGCGQIVTSVGAEVDGALPPPDAAAAVSVYMEAESGKLTGFTIGADPAASGGEYISPPASVQSLLVPGDARAEYSFVLGRPGTYLVWGRLQAPTVDSNAFWVTVDNGPSYRWQLSTGVIWFWGAVTSDADYGNPIRYTLGAGPHQLVFQNSVPGVELDRLYVTVPGDVPPGNDTPCDPPNSIQLADGGCEPSCGSHGNTTCGAACTGLPPLVSYDCGVCCHVPDGGLDAAVADAAAE